MNQKQKDHKFALWVRTSVILTLLRRFVNFLYDSAKKSLIGSILSTYRSNHETARRSALYRFFNGRKIRFQARVILPIKRFFNKSFSESRLLSFLPRNLRRLTDLPVHFYGTIVFSYALYSAALSFLLTYVIHADMTAIYTPLYYGVIALAAFPSLFSKKPLLDALGSSAVFTFLLCKVLGYHPNALHSVKSAKGHTVPALILGVLLSLVALYLPILSMFHFLLMLIGAYLILLRPEVGTILLFGCIPFVSTMQLALLVIYVSVCFLLHWICGKRSLAFEAIDYAVLGFAAFLLIGGVVSLSPAKSLHPALLSTCLIGGYFLVIQTVRTKDNVKRCFGTLAFSAVIESIIGVWEGVFGTLSTQWQDMSLFESIRGRIVGTLQNPNVLAEFLILTIPILFAVCALSKRASGRFGALLLTAIGIAALIFTWSRGAWLGLMIGMIVYAFLASRKAPIALLSIIAILPIGITLIPDNILARITSITNLSDTSTAYRLNVWEGSLALARDHLFGGIGGGLDTFASVYPSYALDGIEAAQHSHNLYLQILIEHGIFGLLIFLACLLLFFQSSFSYLADQKYPSERSMRLFTLAGSCSVLAFLAQGVTEYVFYNYRIFTLFFMLLALITTCRRCALKDRPIRVASDDLYGTDAESYEGRVF